MILPLFAPSAITQPIIMTTNASRVPAPAEVSTAIQSQFNLDATVPVYRLEWDGIKVSAASDESLRNWDDLEDVEIEPTCALCHQTQTNIKESGYCDDCDLFDDLLTTDKDFNHEVSIVLKSITAIDTKIKTGSIIFPGEELTHAVFIPDTSILSKTEKHLFFACQIVSFFRTRKHYHKNLKTNTTKIICGPSLRKRMANQLQTSDLEFATSVINGYTTTLNASFQVPFNSKMVPDFWLLDEGIQGSFFSMMDDGDESTLKVTRFCSITYKDEDNEICGDFEIVDIASATLGASHSPALYILSSDFKKSRAGRCVAVRHPTFTEDLPITDPVYEKKFAEKQQQKKERKEKELKEQERKDRKEREREEQRQLAIQRREQETALRAARAALVTAVAKIDADLERINHLKELNKEVALKNRKIFERKEAEQLAAAAEQRHAEKLKQKEADRQKFITKKI